MSLDRPSDNFTWREAVLTALRRFSLRHGTRQITRHTLLDEELPQIIAETGSQGATPQQTLSRILQELRDEGILQFRGNRGAYYLLDTTVDVEVEDLPDFVLDFALEHNKLRMGAVATAESALLVRQRRGQQRLRALTLRNYGGQCAVCDVSEELLLIASHISRWADDLPGRGDLANVLCLCRFHDPLFEVGYWSLTDDLSALKKPAGNLSRSVATNLDLINGFRPPLAHRPGPLYLQKHRQRTSFAFPSH